MRTKTFLLILASGVAGGLIALLGPANPPPAARTGLRLPPSPPPIARVAAGNDPEIAAAPSPAGEPEQTGHLHRSRKMVTPADVEFGNALRARVLASMRSGFPAGQDQINAWLAEWMQRDPAGAGRFAQTLPAGPWRNATLLRVAQDWAAQDAARAERWAARLSDGTERASTLSAVCFAVAQSDARSAVEIAERNGLGTAPGAVLENLVQPWAEQDAAGAAAWIAGQPAGEGRDQLVGRLAYVQAQTEPAAAADLVVEQLPTGPIQDEAVVSVVHQWALRDPAAAAAWVNRFPAGALHDRARTELQGLVEYPR